MIKVTSDGDFKKTEDYLERVLGNDIFSVLHRYGALGVRALSAATPEDTGLSSISWDYKIIKEPRWPGIEWYNANDTDTDTPVVILIQYGHATGTGGYVVGRDFINPAIQPVFDQIVDEVWRRMTE